VVKKVEDADGEASVTTYTYFEEYGGPHHTFLKTVTHPEGTAEYRNRLLAKTPKHEGRRKQ
jgi:hypothetical protein